MSDKRLWEVKHSYYCNDGNYYDNNCVFEYKSWRDFLEDMGDADLDYNLPFRWDWSEIDPETEESTYKGDNYYRNGKLHIYWMQQRKGRFIISIVDVCRADEPSVVEYLKPRHAYLKSLWEPMT
jgi:hypothetical protein